MPAGGGSRVRRGAGSGHLGECCLRRLGGDPGDGVGEQSHRKSLAQRVEDRRVSGSATCEFELTLAPFGDGGWYWFDLIADEEGMVLDAASWLVPSHGRPVGRVTLGVTTFNRPDYCVNTIRTIAEADGFDDVLAMVERTCDVDIALRWGTGYDAKRWRCDRQCLIH